MLKGYSSRRRSRSRDRYDEHRSSRRRSPPSPFRRRRSPSPTGRRNRRDIADSISRRRSERHGDSRRSRLSRSRSKDRGDLRSRLGSRSRDRGDLRSKLNRSRSRSREGDLRSKLHRSRSKSRERRHSRDPIASTSTSSLMFDEPVHRENDAEYQSLRRENDEMEQMRREIEDEKARLQMEMIKQNELLEMEANKAAASAAMVMSQVPPPPQMETIPLMLPASRPMFRLESPTPPNSFNEEFHARASRSLSTSSAAVPPPVTYQDELRPGNFLLATWETSSRSKDLSSGDFHQIGAFLPHGAEWVKSILPPGSNIEDLIAAKKVFRKGDQICYHATGHIVTPICSMTKALGFFLEFLEKGCKTVRPHYDGVILLSHQQESIPGLLRAIRKCNMSKRFSSVVKGMGDVCTYLAQCHMKKFMEHPATAPVSPAVGADLSLSRVYGVVFGDRINPYTKSAELLAKCSYEVIERLLEAKPGFQNFFSRFISPMESRLMRKLANLRTLKEKLDMFLPLQQYIAHELSRQQGDLIREGIYAPGEEDSPELSEPEQVAQTMCRMLVQASFEFDRLLVLCDQKGTAELELALRTGFLDKMVGQSRAVVGQTIRATRLVTSFYRQFGHMSLEELQQNAKRLQQGHSDEPEPRVETVTSPPVAGPSKVKVRSLEQLLMPVPPPPPPPLMGLNLVEPEKSKVDQPPVSQNDYVEQVKTYEDLALWLKRKLHKLPDGVPKTLQHVFPTEVKIKADMIINVLIYARMTLPELINRYVEDKKVHKSRKQLRLALTAELEPIYRTHGPADVEMSTFLDVLVVYLGPLANSVAASNRKSAAASTTASAVRQAATIETARIALDCAIAALYTSQISVMHDFRNRKFSLAAVREFFVNRLSQMVALCGGDADQVALIGEHVQKLIAFTGFNHYRLRQAFDAGSLKWELETALREKTGLLPPGLTNETLVEYVLEYFRGVVAKNN